jgi:hypothetical protein
MIGKLRGLHAVPLRLWSAQDVADHPGYSVRECPSHHDIRLDSNESHMLVLDARGAQRNAVIRIGLGFKSIE